MRDTPGNIQRLGALIILPSARRIPYVYVNSRAASTASVRALEERSTQLPPLSTMPTSVLWRSLLLTSVMASPSLFTPCLALLERTTRARSTFLNPEKNPVLSKLLKMTVYRHFCAGSNRTEVKQTISSMKATGVKGVILGYAKEFVSASPDDSDHLSECKESSERINLDIVEKWKRGTIETLDMLDQGDILAVKFTGAGPSALDALRKRENMPAAISIAMDEICSKTAQKGCRVWIDAEQQFLQHGVDKWVIELMRRHNRNGIALVYNTIQAYLKGSRPNIQHHIDLAAKEGWTLGIKLVRGAYIEHEVRSLIHDTKEDTDNSYNSITRDLIDQTWPVSKNTIMPGIELFVASHNAESVRLASTALQSRIFSSQPTIRVEFGQLQGMADEISCKLVQDSRSTEWTKCATQRNAGPVIYKCLTWGSLQECLGFLYRRAIENRGAVERTEHMAAALRQELVRRMGAVLTR